MATLIHFVFELFKIGFLSFIYTGLFFLLGPLIQKNDGRKRVFSWKKFKDAQSLVYLALFLFSFTYYGNHGLGDDSYIPLGHGETMCAGDLNAYFYPDDRSGQIPINTYLVQEDKLCAANNDGVIVYNLSTKQISRFDHEDKYNDFAKKQHLPHVHQFIEFERQYNDYWNGWRFFLLP